MLICAEVDVKGLPALKSLEVYNAITVVPIAAPALTCLKWSYHGNEMNGFQAVCSDAMRGMQNLVILELEMEFGLAAVRPLQGLSDLRFCHILLLSKI